MAKLSDLIEELVTANRVLANQGIVDSFGHVSVRHPDNPERFLLSRARAPERVERADIMEFTLEGDPVDAKGRKPYLERFIHGAAYEARPDVMAVIHNHSPSTIPFGITGRKMRPVMHMCATIGYEVPIWDQSTKFGDTNLLVESMAAGRDLAKKLGKGRTALMRGHGALVVGHELRATVYTAVYLELNAKLQMQAEGITKKVRFLTKGEQKKVADTTSVANINRAWENWCRKVDRPFQD
ncbi:MAG TPA: class II aldolase/adducin family protein [Xanthobacteraceae bacterium]|jgi:HCOMODA/2-hydroxy-3-carboxy-muconic semialdehyde decarboxylase|nr:class II aldolase/adducin family protein [Xanthobacteraceae bacterium]